MAPAIPDRWTNYKPIGKQIEGTRFIAFKVPLRESVSNNVCRLDRLDGGMLLERIPNLGLIIDLTNTYRFYEPTVFVNKGVNYKKIMIPGHEVPDRHLTDEFISAVKEFMANNTDNDKLIGVHCTHGVNRTGYLICNYMISQMNIDPKEAIDRFANFRGHKIERKNYIDALTNLTKTNNDNWRKGKTHDGRENGDQSRKYRSSLFDRSDDKPCEIYNSWRRSRRPRINERYSDDKSREKYNSWRRSPSGSRTTERYRKYESPRTSQYSRERRNTTTPYRLSNSTQRTFSSTIPNESNSSTSKATLYKPSLRLDYYNRRPDDDRQRSIRKAYES